MSKSGVGLFVASGSGIGNYGEKKIIGHTEDAEGVSLKLQFAGVEEALGSAPKVNMRGNVVALDGDESYRQNKESNKKTRINYEQG